MKAPFALKQSNVWRGCPASFLLCTSGREVSLVMCRGKSAVLDLIAADADARLVFNPRKDCKLFALPGE